VIGLVAGAVVLAGAGAVAVTRLGHECGGAVESIPASSSTSPFLDADERAEQPDRDRDRLVAALEAAPPPFGEVLGAVGYHYEQWAQVSAYAQGIGIRTRDNPDFTMLDEAKLQPMWSVEVRTKKSTYDASDRSYFVATLPPDTAPDVVRLSADTGRRQWCAALEGPRVGGDDPFATQILPDQSVAVLGPSDGEKERLFRLSAEDGSELWARSFDADSGDFLGEMGEDTLLVGGREQFRLFDPESLADRPEGPALVIVSTKDGRTIWTKRAPAGSDLHVLGTDPEARRAFVQERTADDGQARLTALNSDGDQIWSTTPTREATFDAALMSGRILVRAGNRWSAYDTEDGRRLWTRLLPERPQFLPYGFELNSVPLLDPDHALIGGTTALHTLDLRTGAMTSARLPTDGINTTYWPYQVAVSGGLIAVATNTGAVVVRRE
jgi:outer membrane protein assembly factor BamB